MSTGAERRPWRCVTAPAGLAALRLAVLHAAGILDGPLPGSPLPAGAAGWDISGSWLLSQSAPVHGGGPRSGGAGAPPDDDDPETSRLVALVDLARSGDAEAFGQLYDHYVGTVYRFLYYRVGSHALAEDLTSETFFRALRSMSSFSWQGRDFGAWLVTISRNLVADHFKSGRQRLEMTTDDLTAHDSTTAGPEDDVIAGLTNVILIQTLAQLAPEQQECLVLRFLQGLSIAETAAALGRSEGAVKQLQLRAVRNLAKLLPEGMR
ncbi:MAG: sigma-70 family RNA polymerase sigma factor [Actinomycetota bacterium]|nr:sigma-70 family RNA polymerase sigma factor [Actinomycetota bacterium]